LKSIGNRLLSSNYADIYGLVVGISLLFGLQIVMIIPLSIGLPTTPFSIGFRALILLLSILLIVRSLALSSNMKFSIGYAFLITFWSIYTVRLVYDLSISKVALSPNLVSAEHIYLYALGGTFIPIIAISGLLKTYSVQQLNSFLFWLSLLQVLTIVIIFFKMYGLSLDAFSSRYMVTRALDDANTGKPINVIVLSRSGGILAILAVLHKSNNILSSIVRFLSFILGVGVLILGASRGPFFAFIVTILFIFLYKGFRMKRNNNWLIYWLLFIAVVSLILYFIFVKSIIQETSLFNRVITLINNTNKITKEERYFEWYISLNQFFSSPIIGDEIVSTYSRTYPHNLLLEVLMSTGLTGFIPFVLACYFSFKKGLQFVKKDQSSIFYLFLFLFISMMFSGAIFMSPHFWICMAIILVIPIKTSSIQKLRAD
jgi:O-antigen ligase